jgi:hypothetical protein
VVLSNPTGATIGTGTATVTILDDEKPLVAAAPATNSTPIGELTAAQLDSVARQAKLAWATAVPEADLSGISFFIADLDGLMLGCASGSEITIDGNAAGYGWFVDPTPSDAREFRGSRVNGELVALASSPAFGHMDLLTVVMHELGHVIGFEDLTSPLDAGDLMYETLPAGVRRAEARLLAETWATPKADVWYYAGASKGAHSLFDDWLNDWWQRCRLLAS